MSGYAHVRNGVIRCRGDPAASPAMSAVTPKAEVNSEGRAKVGRKGATAGVSGRCRSQPTGSDGLAAQEGRHVKSVLLDRIAQRRAAVRIEALRSRVTWAELWTLERRRRGATLDPAGDATVVAAQPVGKFG